MAPGNSFKDFSPQKLLIKLIYTKNVLWSEEKKKQHNKTSINGKRKAIPAVVLEFSVTLLVLSYLILVTKTY